MSAVAMVVANVMDGFDTLATRLKHEVDELVEHVHGMEATQSDEIESLKEQVGPAAIAAEARQPGGMRVRYARRTASSSASKGLRATRSTRRYANVQSANSERSVCVPPCEPLWCTSM